LPDFARQERLCQGRHPGRCGNAARDDLRSGRAQARFSGGRAGPEAVSERAAAPGNRPVQDRRSASPQDWVPRCREHPVPTVVGDAIQAQARSASCLPVVSRKRRHAGALLPAGRQENVLPALLCTTMWITCVKRRRACAHIGEMLGIVLPGRARNRAFTWESAIHALWTEKEPELSTHHAATAHK